MLHTCSFLVFIHQLFSNAGQGHLSQSVSTRLRGQDGGHDSMPGMMVLMPCVADISFKCWTALCSPLRGGRLMPSPRKGSPAMERWSPLTQCHLYDNHAMELGITYSDDDAPVVAANGAGCFDKLLVLTEHRMPGPSWQR